MFKNEKNIIVIMVIIALIIFFAFMVKTVYEQREIYKVSNTQQVLDYKMYGFITNNSMDSVKMQGIYKKVGNRFCDKMNFEIVNVSENSSLSNKYKVHITPSFIILDKYGNVIKRQNGILEYEQLVDIISKAIDMIGKEGIITIDESKTTHTQLNIVEGLKINNGYISSYMMGDSVKNEEILENPYILLCNRK